MSEFVTGTGQVLVDVHRETVACLLGCPVHAPTPHGMERWPLHWRADRGLMERVCPHGIGHPDPDHVAHTARRRGRAAAGAAGVHGCDGCCAQARGAGRG